MPAYGMSVRIDAPLDQALDRARAALSQQGFGILTEIAADAKARLQNALGALAGDEHR